MAGLSGENRAGEKRGDIAVPAPESARLTDVSQSSGGAKRTQPTEPEILSQSAGRTVAVLQHHDQAINA